jgi:hypothetical protein
MEVQEKMCQYEKNKFNKSNMVNLLNILHHNFLSIAQAITVKQ